jgi:hypothetical protein
MQAVLLLAQCNISSMQLHHATSFILMVTLLLMGPTRLVSYTTEISDFAPGAMGSALHCGTVHPQEPLHREMIRGSFPVLVTVNTQAPSAFCGIVP